MQIQKEDIPTNSGSKVIQSDEWILEWLTWTPVLIPFLVAKSPIAKEARKPDVGCVSTAGTSLSALPLHSLYFAVANLVNTEHHEKGEIELIPMYPHCKIFLKICLFGCIGS